MQKEIEKITTNKNEEVVHLKNHNDKLLTQIKTLKKDKKTLGNKVQQLVEKESSKPTNVKVQVEEKSNVDPVNVSTKEDDKQVTEETNLDARKTRNILSEGSVTYSITSLPKENQSQTKKVPYRHPNHGSRQLSRAMYSKQKHADSLKNTNESSQVTSHRKISQKIDLRWSDPFSM